MAVLWSLRDRDGEPDLSSQHGGDGVHDVTRAAVVFSPQVRVAVTVCSWEPAGSVAVEL